jgi:hypothetical protein
MARCHRRHDNPYKPGTTAHIDLMLVIGLPVADEQLS